MYWAKQLAPLPAALISCCMYAAYVRQAVWWGARRLCRSLVSWCSKCMWMCENVCMCVAVVPCFPPWCPCAWPELHVFVEQGQAKVMSGQHAYVRTPWYCWCVLLHPCTSGTCEERLTLWWPTFLLLFLCFLLYPLFCAAVQVRYIRLSMCTTLFLCCMAGPNFRLT